MAIILLTADRGLCGSFNTNLITLAGKETAERFEQGQTVCFFTVGRKGRDFFRRRHAEIFGQYVDNPTINYDLAAQIAGDVMNAYSGEKIDEAVLIYSQFINLAVQKPTVRTLLPFSPLEETNGAADYLYEPAPHILLETVLPEQIRVQVYHALLETNTSEQAARMTAMDNASRNCKDMIDHLTLAYNKARQAAITQELMDIVGGAEALKQ